MATFFTDMMEARRVADSALYEGLFGWVPKVREPKDGLLLDITMSSGQTWHGYLVRTGMCPTVQILTEDLKRSVRLSLRSIESVTHA